ncbi:hypothetical protein pb186bvf_020483 [Paramecium bursaria]
MALIYRKYNKLYLKQSQFKRSLNRSFNHYVKEFGNHYINQCLQLNSSQINKSFNHQGKCNIQFCKNTLNFQIGARLNMNNQQMYQKRLYFECSDTNALNQKLLFHF